MYLVLINTYFNYKMFLVYVECFNSLMIAFVFLKLKAIRLHTWLHYTQLSMLSTTKNFGRANWPPKIQQLNPQVPLTTSNLLGPLLIKITRVSNSKAGFKRSCLRALTENICCGYCNIHADLAIFSSKFYTTSHTCFTLFCLLYRSNSHNEAIKWHETA